MATRFVANRVYTSLSAIYSHFNARTKSERQRAVGSAFGSLRRSARGRENIARIEKRRASARKAAQTRRENKERETRRYGQDVDEYERSRGEYPNIPTQTDRRYSETHAYVILLIYAEQVESSTPPLIGVEVTIMSQVALTVGELDDMIWEYYGPGNDLPDRYGRDLVDWRLLAHYYTEGV